MRKLCVAIACTAILSGCSPKTTKIQTEPLYDNNNFEFSAGGYNYRGYIDYKQAVDQAHRSFISYVKTGSYSSRSSFTSAMKILIDGKDAETKRKNIQLLLQNKIYADIRNAYVKVNKNKRLAEFLSAIEEVKQSKEDEKLISKYGADFINAVKIYGNKK